MSNTGYISGLILLVIIKSGLCQPDLKDYPYITEEHDFVKAEFNKLRFYGDSSSYDSLFNRFDALIFSGTGKINIVHIGGSHIQADMWSGQLRKNLQTYLPGTKAERGFIFPFKMARTNNPYHYYPTFTGTWTHAKNSYGRKPNTFGLAGYVVTTEDSLSEIMIRFRGDEKVGNLGYDFNKVKVFHTMDSSSFCLELKDTSLIHVRYENNSLGYTEFYFRDFQDTLELKIVKKDTGHKHFSLYGLTLENPDPGFVYNAIGVNGASAPSYLKCQLFEPHLDVLDPNLVVLSIGINDAYEKDFTRASFERNYDSLITRIRRVAPNTAILLTTNNDSYYKRRYPNKNGELVRLSMIKIAKKHNCAVWDMYGVMGGFGSVKTWERNRMAKKDKIHFTRDGYYLVGDLMFKALMQAYDKHIESVNWE